MMMMRMMEGKEGYMLPPIAPSSTSHARVSIAESDLEDEFAKAREAQKRKVEARLVALQQQKAKLFRLLKDVLAEDERAKVRAARRCCSCCRGRHRCC